MLDASQDPLAQVEFFGLLQGPSQPFAHLEACSLLLVALPRLPEVLHAESPETCVQGMRPCIISHLQ